jgi:hypothetical protein
MVPIPEGVERSDEEPANESYALAAQSDGGGSSSSTSATLTQGAQDAERLTLGSGSDEDEIRG